MARVKHIDQIDINLLNTMKLNPQYSIAQLGKVIDLSPGPTHTRLKHLQKHGFFKDDYKIMYEKFGLQEKVCFFELKPSEENYGNFHPQRVLDHFIKKLPQVYGILIESLELFSDAEDKNWIMIRFYPEINQAPRKSKDGKIMSYDYEIELSLLFGKYFRNKKYLHLDRKVEIPPMLTPLHRMKNEPPI